MLPSHSHRGTGETPVIWLLSILLLAFAPVSLPAQQNNNGAPSPGAVSDATVWGALVFASDGADAASASAGNDAAFASIAGRLAKVFPEKHFSLLGQHTQEIFREYESWVVPSKELFLKIDSKGPAPSGGMQLHIQLWQDTKVVVKTDAILKADSPLFIRGPEWRGGHLIFVVMLTAQAGR